MTASATTSGGEVTFSVWDPASKVNFLLPTHNSNGVEQLNLFNGNNASLTIYGSTNYAGNPNTGSAANQWAAPTLKNALGYVPPLPVMAVPYITGGTLREMMEFHVGQVQYNIAENTMVAGVTVSAPEEIAFISSRKGGKKLTLSDDSALICGDDDRGEVYCGEE